MAASNEDIVEKFIANDRKAILTTILSVAGLMLFSSIVIFLLLKLKSERDEKDAAKAETLRALSRADSLIGELEAAKAALNNRAPRYIRFSEAAMAFQTNPGREITRSIFRRSTLYIHYQPPFKDLNERLIAALSEKGARVPPSEEIGNINYSTSIKFFNDEDQALADSVARLINSLHQEISSTGIPVVKSELKAPSGQLEIWLGRYKKPGETQLLKRYQ